MNEFVMGFIRDNITDVIGKSIIEVGALNINGSARDIIAQLGPSKYIGIDLTPGNGVDMVMDATLPNLNNILGRYDIVICTETIEHTYEWEKCVSNLKRLANPGGVILVSTRSLGYGCHMGCDYWRYSLDDMKYIFSDCTLIASALDNEPGICCLFRKPEDFVECSILGYKLLPTFDQSIANIVSTYAPYCEQLSFEISTALSLMRHYFKTGIAIDIGTYRGGTTNMISTIFDEVITVDDQVRWKDTISLRDNIVPVVGDSHSMDVYNSVRDTMNGRKADVIFIDGDHSRNGVKQDFFMYSKFIRDGGIVLFHDIVDHPIKANCDVCGFWNDIKKGNEIREIVENREQTWAGIGVMYV